jgi:hypothetical protein
MVLQPIDVIHTTAVGNLRLQANSGETNMIKPSQDEYQQYRHTLHLRRCTSISRDYTRLLLRVIEEYHAHTDAQ